MEPIVVSPFAAWDNFYVIVGSSGAALTGLQFVVIALAADAGVVRGQTIGAFGTPTIVHFSAAFLIAAILSVPWQAVSSAVLALGACGAVGVVYALIVINRARRGFGTDYQPVLEDWLWHCALPLIAYTALLVAALLLRRDPTHCLFVIAATALLLLFIGIHNAWDSVTYIAAQKGDAHRNDADHPRGR